MDRFIVRLSIILLTLFIYISIQKAWNGVLLSEYDYLFSCSLMCGILLNTLVYSQGKYHCVYMRGLCANLIFTPLVTFIDNQYVLFESEELLKILTYSWRLAFIVTIILAVNHFIKVTKILNKKNYGIRRGKQRKVV